MRGVKGLSFSSGHTRSWSTPRYWAEKAYGAFLPFSVMESTGVQPDGKAPPALPGADGLVLPRECSADAGPIGEASVDPGGSDMDSDDLDDVMSAGCCYMECDVTDLDLLKKCTRCKMALNCSRVCQTKDSKIHKPCWDAVASGSIKLGNEAVFLSGCFYWIDFTILPAVLYGGFLHILLDILIYGF